MSMSILVALFVIVAFVVGVSFLFRGYIGLADAGKTAPLADLEKAHSDLKVANTETEKARAQANTLAVELDEMKGKLTWAQGNVKSLEDTLRKSSQAYARIEQLEKDLTFLSQKADSQAREAIDVITQLAAETEVLKLQSAVPSPAGDLFSSVDVKVITDENQKLKIQVDGYTSKVKDLEAAVVAAQDEGAKYVNVTQTNSQFSQENVVLKKNLAELEEKIKVAQGEAEQFTVQQAKAVDELQAKIAQLETQPPAVVSTPVESAPKVPAVNIAASEDELRRVRIQSEEMIVQANSALVRLNSDVEMLTSQIADKDTRIKKLTEDLFSTRDELSVSLRTVNELKLSPSAKVSYPVIPDAERDELQKRFDDLAAVNQRLLDKGKILTYKLAQSRAQALSLERLCDELKQSSEHDTVLK